MFCSQCGSQIPEDAVFCPECGERTEVAFMEESHAPEQPVYAQETDALSSEQPVYAQGTDALPSEQPVNTQERNAPQFQQAQMNEQYQQIPPTGKPKKQKKAKDPKTQNPKKTPVSKLLVAVIGIAAVFVLCCVAVLAMLLLKKDYDIVSDQAMYIDYDNGYAFDSNGNSLELADDLYEFGRNADGSITAYTTDDEEKTLYYVKDLKETKIAEGVSHFTISYTGDVIAYVQTERYDSVGTLYLYSVKNNESNKIADDVYISGLILSPKGEKVAYLGEYEDIDDNKLYISGKNGKATEIEKDGSAVIGLNDRGNVVYYIKNSKLYVRIGKEETKICSDLTSNSFYFNRDMTEVLYHKDGKTYLYSLSDDDSVKLVSGAINNIFMPNDAAVYYNNEMSHIQIIGKSSFANTLVHIDDETYWINKKGDACVELASYDNYQGGVQINGKYTGMLYRDSSALYRVDRLYSNMQPEMISKDENVQNFAASADLRKVYIVNDDDELFFLKNRKNVLISNDITDTQMVYSDALDAVVFVEDGELYYAKTSQRSKQLITDEDVSSLRDRKSVV